jgi:hypothetical protein
VSQHHDQPLPRTEITFKRPFRLQGATRPEPAGCYVVEIQEELIEGLSSSAWRRVSTTLTRQAAAGATLQAIPVSPKELAAAQAADAESPGP